ncbi:MULTISPECIES: DUF4097 family beta strand repeat-containing protein [Enterocloster]|uniref:DUF4097 family beta strand repeat-containing protein n=1 Tax=Enterocloster TaxID=2719313 RepID=UPI002E8DFCFB|nr:DUF4097 family beta strand repeat-containing protein [Enterocloster lavalensis]
MIKICAVAGAVMLVAGILTTFAAVSFGGARRLGSGVKNAVHRAMSWADDDWADDLEDPDYWDELWEDDFWSDEASHSKRRVQNPPGDGAGQEPGLPAQAGSSGLGSAGGNVTGPSGENAGNPAGAAGNLPGSQARSGPAAMEEREDGSWHVTGVSEMDIEVDRGSVRVISSAQAEDISVRIKDETGRARCYLDDDKLKIERGEFKSSRKEAKIEVIVPENYYFDKVEVEAGAAACEINGIVTRKLELQSGVSSMAFTGRVDEKLEVETGVGVTSVKLTGSREDYNYKIQCGAGSVNIDGDQYSSLGVERKIDNRAARSMELECGVGTIEVQFTGSL